MAIALQVEAVEFSGNHKRMNFKCWKSWINVIALWSNIVLLHNKPLAKDYNHDIKMQRHFKV